MRILLSKHDHNGMDIFEKAENLINSSQISQLRVYYSIKISKYKWTKLRTNMDSSL